MFLILALGSAALYGAADFIGGLSARRADTMSVVVVSQAAGLVLVGVMLVFLPAQPQPMDWVWGAIAGATGGSGVALLYRALAVGVMAVVAPVTAVCAVAVPVAVAVALGERPVAQTIAGIALALAAIVLVSQQSDDQSAEAHRTRKGLGLALISGVLIGLFFLTLARTSTDAGLWPLLTARIVSVALFGALIAGLGRGMRMPASVVPIVVAGGTLDMLANLLYLLAARQGPLTVVVTLSSLYPASTVMLARLVFGERLNARQWAGVVSAIAAIVLIVGGTT